MTDAKNAVERRVETLGCPVCGETVKVSVAYKGKDVGKKTLVDFECDRQGTCGIPDWDPCPFYVTYRDD